jgi:DNA-binding NarL/FixJ family response regulator
MRALANIPSGRDVDPGWFYSSRIENGGALLILQITPLERAALQLLADGKATHEMAHGLGLSECEVEAQLTTLFARMGAASRADAIADAGRRGLLTDDAHLHDQLAEMRVFAP